MAIALLVPLTASAQQPDGLRTISDQELRQLLSVSDKVGDCTLAFQDIGGGGRRISISDARAGLERAVDFGVRFSMRPEALTYAHTVYFGEGNQDKIGYVQVQTVEGFLGMKYHHLILFYEVKTNRIIGGILSDGEYGLLGSAKLTGVTACGNTGSYLNADAYKEFLSKSAITPVKIEEGQAKRVNPLLAPSENAAKRPDPPVARDAR